MRTYIPKDSEINKKVYLVDADGKTLGRLATKVASILIGKHKPLFCQDKAIGDSVVVINCEKIYVTGKKVKDKIYKHYTGYQGGLKNYTYEELQAKQPEEIIHRAVSRMLPKTSLGQKMLKQLTIQVGADYKNKSALPLEV